MINITNGSTTISVTNGSFKSIYEPTGWELCEKQKKTQSKDIDVKEDMLQDEQNEQDDLKKIPVDEMTGPQLRQVAESFGIVTQNKSKDNVKKEVKKAMGLEA